MYFVYILQSERTGRFYVGSTDHLLRRFHQHRTGQNRATRGRGPWWMPWFEVYPTRAAAVRREHQIKQAKSADAIGRIIRTSTAECT